MGALAGGRSDSVELLAAGDDRLVVKIKHGAWWADQLVRAVPVTAALRDAGYPAPEVRGHGPLGADRFYFATEYFAGEAPERLDAALTEDILAAVERQAAVCPPEVRDWSTMIRAFLNGGVADHRFDPSVAALVDRALDLVERPVPALPTGEFVHGDFAAYNLLATGGRLRGVVDVEAFGRSTRTIDLVALLASAITTGADQTITNQIAAAAIAASDRATFRACLAHRALALLLTDPTTGADLVPQLLARAT
ncbi:phosphotransferase family enzyme [Asanoa ferruginea]|uniref:Phosphotransferase family enzyme n=1 Tax=Asanoa ferruginea TaxID=53367 RepID=A0A3D9ZRT6_9ACTN|nr:aminoglycoside phosphotransferase family protein [Asanoa ferruginea]REF99931.1 phosphotransferase family enzyme [Asanoa ferruginea]GIF53698.1 hypothetical protein Afe04nite_82370 [Asanoa ferruginea]